MADTGGMTSDIFSSAATSGLVPPSVPSGTGGAVNPQDILKQLIQASQTGQNGQVNGQPLTTFGAQPPKPNIPPAASVNASQVAQGSFQSSGEAKRANKQALFNNVASIVKQGVDTVHQKKVAQVQGNVTRLLGAIEGLNEAKASGDQKAIAHNMSIVNMMLDPTTPEGKKRIKELQKAFNVNLLGESKDTKSPEYQGFLKAYKQYGEDKAAGKPTMNPIAQRLMASMPQRAQLNPALAAQGAAVKAGVIPDANAQLAAQTNDQNSAADRAQGTKIQQMKDETDLKVAQMTAGRISESGTNILDPTSQTGVSRLQQSADGKSIRVTKDVIVPAILPSSHEGSTTLAIPDPDSPTGVSFAQVPTHTATQKTLPGGGGTVQKDGTAKPNTPAVGTTKGNVSHKETSEGVDKANKLGLPRGSVVVGAKSLTPDQVEKLKLNSQTLDGTITRLKDIRQYTDLYASMIKGGKIKLVTDQKSGKRIIGGWLPSTDEEKKAAAAWQESAEYMNSFRQGLAAQGFRSIPAYDNMLNLRGQIWQNSTILNKTIDDGIKFLSDRKKVMDGAIPKDNSDKTNDNSDDKDNPGGLKFN